MIEKIDAWWFAAGDRLPNDDNRPIVVGETHSISGPIILCKHALHANRDPFDALRYAPGPYLYRVRVWGDVVEDVDKLGGRHREYLAMRDTTDMLRRYARNRALSVANLWNIPAVVLQYLETGDETLREAALAASARSTVWLAVWSKSAWSTARAAAGAAAWSTESAAKAAMAARLAARESAAARSAEAPTQSAAAKAENRQVFGEMVAELFNL